PVFAFQVLSKPEVAVIPLVPDLFFPMRPRVQPFFDKTPVACQKPVLIANRVDKDCRLKQGRLVFLWPPGECLAGHAFIRCPAPVGVNDRVSHRSEGGQNIALAAGIRSVDRRNSKNRVAETWYTSGALIVCISDTTGLQGECLL